MDDVDFASSPIFFLIVGGVLLILFLYLFRSTRKTLDRAAAPRSSLSYECVATPLDKADAELRAKFPNLASVGSEQGVEVVRFGLFNWGALELPADQVDRPVSIAFKSGTQVLSAEFAEAIKTEFTLSKPLAVEGNIVTFPRFGLPPRGTVIFNIIVRGPGEPESVVGEISGGVPIRRLS
jgi:hypothetical protein